MRNPFNTNQELFLCSMFNGLSVQTHQGPLIAQYLERLYRMLGNIMVENRRMFVARLDLRFSNKFDIPNTAVTNQHIQRFLRSLQAKLNHKDEMVYKNTGRVNRNRMSYAWAREIGQESGRPHYHVMLVLNGDAYRSVGDYSNPEAPGLFRRIQEAWATAIDLDFDLANGLVSVVPNGQWMLHRGDGQTFADVFYACSYLCKAGTKVYELGFHGFGCSR